MEEEIEKLRKELDSICNSDNLTSEKVINLSQRIDKLLLAYQTESRSHTI